MTWRPPGEDAHPNRWRYDLRKGFVPPGHGTDPAGTQYEMPQGYDPHGAPKGFHVVESPPGTAAPIGAINYTPDTREVHDVGTLAPVDKRNISLIPESGLHRLAYSRQAQRQAQSGMGAGQDQPQTQPQPFPGTPPISSNFPRPQTQAPQIQLQQSNSGSSPTSSPPGSPYGRQPLGIGAGQDETDPTAGVDTSAPSADETTGPDDPNWANVGPEYTGHRRVDATHVAEMVNGKPIGFWIKKPGATDLDPNAWSFRSSPAAAGDKVTWKEEPQKDGSIIMRASNGDVKRIAAPKGPAGQTGVTWGPPKRDDQGNLVQQGSNGEIRVIDRIPAPRTPQTTWGQPYQAPDGSYVQQSSTGEIRGVPGTKLTTATEKWGPPESKPDGSIWQQNTTTGKWEIVQAPDTKLTDPFTVGNRLVKFDPESNTYKEVYRAPQNMSLQTLGNGSIVGINQETGEQTPILDDPTTAAAAGLKQRQGEQALLTGETSRQATEMGMIPQPSISGGNLIVPEGAEADVSYWDPTTGQTTRSTLGHRRSVPDLLQSHGFEQPPAQTYTPPAAPAGAGVPSTTPDAPIPSGGGATVSGALAPAGVAGTSGDPTIQADTAGYTPPPDTGPQGGLGWLFSSPASPVDNPANVPQDVPTDEPAADDAQPDDESVVDDMGAGADRRRTDSQSDLMIDIPRFAHRRKWKGLGSKFLGRGLDDFQPFVGVGQDSGVLGAAGQLPPSAPPSAGQGGAAIPPPPAGGGLGGPPMPGMNGKAPGKWDPQQLQQLLPLLLMLLSGGSGGGAPGGAPPSPAQPAPAATPPMPGSPPAAPPGMGGGGMGMGQDEGLPDWDPNAAPGQGPRQVAGTPSEYMPEYPEEQIRHQAGGSQYPVRTMRSEGPFYGLTPDNRGIQEVSDPGRPVWPTNISDMPDAQGPTAPNPYGAAGNRAALNAEGWGPITPIPPTANATQFDPSTVLRPTESGPTQVNPWREFGPRMLPGVLEGGPTMLPQMPGESGPGMLDTSPVSSQVQGFDPRKFRNLDPQGVELAGGWGEFEGGEPDTETGRAGYRPFGTVPDWKEMVQRGMLGTGQDAPSGFQPPIDPQHVVGTGHKFGQAMNAGDPVHRGVDLQAPKGTPVKAPVDGVVKINHNPQGLGLEAVVISPDGKEHKLGHLSSVTVKPGQQVKAGQVIGQVGDSGLTTGANLHYAEKKGGKYFNPSGKMGVLADLPPAPGTQMMSADGAGGGPPGAGQDLEPGQGFPNLYEKFSAGRLASMPNSGVDPDHPFGSYEESATLPSQTDIEDYLYSTSTPAKVPRDPSQPSMVLSGPIGEDTPLYPWTRPDRQPPPDSGSPDFGTYVPPIPMYDDSMPYAPSAAPNYRPPPKLKQAVLGAGAEAQRLGVGAGAQFTVALPEGGFKTVNASDPVAARINAGVPPTSQVQAGGHQAHQEAGTATAGAAAGSPASLAGGGGGGASVSVDPATQARIQSDLKIAQQQHDASMAQIQQSANAENDRHAEELQRLQQAATQEADFRAIQEAVNAENVRHNQATEQLQRQQQALDVQLEQMREQSSMALQRESEGFQQGQTARQNALGILQGSLSNPWLQALTSLGITPGGGASGGSNPLMNLLNQILGGANAGNLQQAGVPGGNQLPNVSPQEFQAMSTAQKAGLRTQIEAMGPGMWQQFLSNFQNKAGTNQAPDQTQLQQAIWTPEDAAGSQMSAEMFGEGQPAFQQRQQKNWAPAQGTNVMQSLLAGTGFG